jgi:hypothetical protein
MKIHNAQYKKCDTLCNCLDSITTFLKGQTVDLQNISLTECKSGTTPKFGVHIMTELQNATASNNNGIQRGIFQLTSLLIFLDAVVVVLNSNVVLTTNDNFWVVSLLHSVNAKTLQKRG